MNSQEITIQEVFGAVSLTYPNLARHEVGALQWAYEAQLQMSEGEGFQKIGWSWTNDGTYTNTWVAVPTDVVAVDEVYVGGCLMIEKTDDYKKGLNADEYYMDGPYIHLLGVPGTVECKVRRIKRDDEGNMLLLEGDSIAIRYYILWMLYQKDALAASNQKTYRMEEMKAQSMYRQWLIERQKARGHYNTQKEHKMTLANVEWNNMFNSLRKTW